MTKTEKKMVTTTLPQFAVIDYGDTVFLLGIVPEGTKPDEVDIDDRDIHKDNIWIVGLDWFLRSTPLMMS